MAAAREWKSEGIKRGYRASATLVCVAVTIVLISLRPPVLGYVLGVALAVGAAAAMLWFGTRPVDEAGT